MYQAGSQSEGREDKRPGTSQEKILPATNITGTSQLQETRDREASAISNHTRCALR